MTSKVRLQIDPAGNGKQLVQVSIGPSLVYSRLTTANFSIEQTLEFLDRLRLATPDVVQGLVSKWVKNAEAGTRSKRKH